MGARRDRVPMSADDAIALYRAEQAASFMRNLEKRLARRAKVARIVADADRTSAVVGRNGRPRGPGISVPRTDKRELLPHTSRGPG